MTKEKLDRAIELRDEISRYKRLIYDIEKCEQLVFDIFGRGYENSDRVKAEDETKAVILEHYKQKLEQLEKEFEEL